MDQRCSLYTREPQSSTVMAGSLIGALEHAKPSADPPTTREQVLPLRMVRLVGLWMKPLKSFEGCQRPEPRLRTL